MNMTPRTGPSLSPRSLLRFITLALLVALSAPLASQAQGARTAALHGTISDKGTGLTLEGARIDVGTERTVYSGRDGTYSVAGLPLGEFQLTVSYPGLDNVTRSVTLASGDTSVDFGLTSEVYTLGALVVSSQREGNAASIARQENALTLGNSISMDAYGNVAKGDMGSFLQRLPGIVGDYGGSAVDAVAVRGLSAELTTVTMDGVRAASANPDSRSQLVSSMPADAIESVEVIKTPTADMDADSMGGVVNLVPRSGFDRTGRSFVFSASENYNQTFGKHIDPEGGKKYLYPQLSGMYSDVFAFGDRKLGVAVTANYQEVGEAPSTLRSQFASDWDYSSPSVARRVVYTSQEYHVNKRAGLNTKFDLKLDRDNSLSFSAGYTRFRNYMEQVRPQYQDSVTLDTANSTSDYWVFSRVRYRNGHDFRTLDYDTWRFKLDGKHSIGEFKLNWSASWENSDRALDRISASARSANNFTMIYDRTVSTYYPALTYTGGISPDVDTFSNLSQVGLTATHENSSNTIRNASANLSREYPDLRFPLKLKAGMKVREERRDRDIDYLEGTAASGNYSDYRLLDYTHGWMDGHYKSTAIFDTKKIFSDYGVAYKGDGQWDYNGSFPLNATASQEDSLANDYSTRETIPAFYTQGEIELARKLKTTLGLRYEQTQTKLRSRYVDATAATIEEMYGNFETTSGSYDTWFPNVQLRYEPFRHLIVRTAYSTTIGRPRLSDLVSTFSVNETEQSISFSNTSLKPQISRNYDLSVEYYFEPVGVLSVGVFRKEIKDYVTSLSFTVEGNEFGMNLSQYAGWTGTSKINAGKGTVDGVELNYAQQFNFLPGCLRYFGVMGNWTALTSEGDYNGVIASLPFKNYLTGLRPKSGNAGLTFNDGRVDLRMMWNYQSSYLASLSTSDPSSSDFIGARSQWDFFARYNINKTYNVFLDVINLFENDMTKYQGQVSLSRLSQTVMFSRSITLGVQARF